MAQTGDGSGSAVAFRRFTVRKIVSVKTRTALSILVCLIIFVVGGFTGYATASRSCISTMLDVNDSIFGLIFAFLFGGLSAGTITFSIALPRYTPAFSALTAMSNGVFMILVGVVINHYEDHIRSGRGTSQVNLPDFNSTSLLCNEDRMELNVDQSGYGDSPRTGVSVTLAVVFWAIGVTAGLPVAMIFKNIALVPYVVVGCIFSTGSALGMMIPRQEFQDGSDLDVNCCSGFIICGSAVFLLGACFIGFPASMFIATDDFCINYIPGNRGNLRECFGQLGAFLRKWTFWGLLFVVSLDVLYIGVYINIFPKFLALYFDLYATTASVTAGVSLVFPYGLIAAATYYASRRLQQVRNLILICTAIVCFGHFILLFIRCEPTVWNKDTVQSHDKFVLKNICNDKCGCRISLNDFQPACHKETGMTFASPCYAGCLSWVADNQTFTNCECVMDGKENLLEPETVIMSPGICPRSCQVGLWVTILTLTLTISFGGYIPLTFVDQWQKSATVSEMANQKLIPKTAFFSLILLIGILPAPVISGLLLDSTCVLRNSAPSPETTSLQYTTCLIYASDKLGNRLNGLLLLAKIVISTLYFTVFKYSTFLKAENITPESTVQYHPITSSDSASLVS